MPEFSIGCYLTYRPVLDAELGDARGVRNVGIVDLMLTQSVARADTPGFRNRAILTS